MDRIKCVCCFDHKLKDELISYGGCKCPKDHGICKSCYQEYYEKGTNSNGWLICWACRNPYTQPKKIIEEMLKIKLYIVGSRKYYMWLLIELGFVLTTIVYMIVSRSVGISHIIESFYLSGNNELFIDDENPVCHNIQYYQEWLFLELLMMIGVLGVRHMIRKTLFRSSDLVSSNRVNLDQEKRNTVHIFLRETKICEHFKLFSSRGNLEIFMLIFTCFELAYGRESWSPNFLTSICIIFLLLSFIYKYRERLFGHPDIRSKVTQCILFLIDLAGIHLVINLIPDWIENTGFRMVIACSGMASYLLFLYMVLPFALGGFPDQLQLIRSYYGYPSYYEEEEDREVLDFRSNPIIPIEVGIMEMVTDPEESEEESSLEMVADPEELVAISVIPASVGIGELINYFRTTFNLDIIADSLLKIINMGSAIVLVWSTVSSSTEDYTEKFISEQTYFVIHIIWIEVIRLFYLSIVLSLALITIDQLSDRMNLYAKKYRTYLPNFNENNLKSKHWADISSELSKIKSKLIGKSGSYRINIGVDT